MPPTKKVSKKSLEYVRPEPGRFTLEAFKGEEFSFRKISIDDEAWSVQTFGKTPWEVITEQTIMASDLCRLYFHFLTPEGKEKFIPKKIQTRDYETGEMKEEILSGPRLFMKSIDGGSVTEMALISQAFVKTVLASRPLTDLPDDLKKRLLARLEPNREKDQGGPKPMAKEPDGEAPASA